MYKIANDLAQRRARQMWLADLQGSEFQALTPEEQRDSLKAKLLAIEAEMMALPKGPVRDALGQVKFELQEQMRAIRPKKKAPGAAEHFINVARERLSKAQYNAFMAEAARRANLQDQTELKHD